MAPRKDNQKAVEARERKAAVAREKAAAAQKAKEDAAWRDEGTKVQRQKDARKAEAEQKADEARRRREERLKLEKEELQAFAGTKKGAGKLSPPKKLTQYDIARRQLLAAASAEKLRSDGGSSRIVSDDGDDIAPNTNHLRRREVFDALLAGHELIHATGIDDALQQLSQTNDNMKVDMHPERRAKVLYKSFEERELRRLRSEFPGMKLSQYQERVYKLWQKSPENPMNKE